MRLRVALFVIATILCASCGMNGNTSIGTPSATPAIATSTRVWTATPVDNLPYPAAAVGFAISWPQCGGPYPGEPFDFGIVGVTDGQARTRNPCFAEEFRWAQHGRYHPSIYMNLNYKESAADFPDCGGDLACRAYRYGLEAARDAYAYAESFDAVASVWWLDVQIVSDWSNDVALNGAAILGVAEYLRAKGIRLGISSTSFQWATVAGAARHGLPVWDASAVDADQAADFCRAGKDFGGGRTEQVAYVEDGFEFVLACGPAAPLD